MRPLRYLIAGAFNTAVSYGAFAVATLAGLSLAPASAIGLFAGIGVGYFTQGGLVFRALSREAFYRFVLAWGVMYALFLGSATLLTALEMGPLVAGALSTTLITLLSYFLLRVWVFRV